MRFTRALLLYFKLNLTKLLIHPQFRSAKDADRLRFEWELCKVASGGKKVLFVGLHERSFVYQLILPFIFIDISDDYLVKAKENVLHGACEDITDEFDLVILAGVLDFGTEGMEFLELLEKANFKNILIQDRKDNIGFHTEMLKSSSYSALLKNVFFYYK